MRLVRLGEKKLRVSCLGVGCWNWSGYQTVAGKELGWPPISSRALRGLFRHAIELGIRFFDTSSFYGTGRAERLLGTFLQEADDDIVVATKGGLISESSGERKSIQRDFRPAAIRQSVEGSLRRLKRDYIDLFQLHGPSEVDLHQENLWRLLEQLVNEGKLLAYGVSVRRSLASNERHLLSLFEEVPGTTVQLPVSSGHLGATPWPRGRGKKAIIGQSPLYHGLMLRGPSHRRLGQRDHRRTAVTPRLWKQIDEHQELARQTAQRFGLLPLQIFLGLAGFYSTTTLVGVSTPTQLDEMCRPSDHRSVSTAARVFAELAGIELRGASSQTSYRTDG